MRAAVLSVILTAGVATEPSASLAQAGPVVIAASGGMAMVKPDEDGHQRFHESWWQAGTVEAAWGLVIDHRDLGSPTPLADGTRLPSRLDHLGGTAWGDASYWAWRAGVDLTADGLHPSWRTLRVRASVDRGLSDGWRLGLDVDTARPSAWLPSWPLPTVAWTAVWQGGDATIGFPRGAVHLDLVGPVRLDAAYDLGHEAHAWLVAGQRWSLTAGIDWQAERWHLDGQRRDLRAERTSVTATAHAAPLDGLDLHASVGHLFHRQWSTTGHDERTTNRQRAGDANWAGGGASWVF
jgi:hypothetical protein